MTQPEYVIELSDRSTKVGNAIDADAAVRISLLLCERERRNPLGFLPIAWEMAMSPRLAIPAAVLVASFCAAAPASSGLWSPHELVGINDSYNDRSAEIAIDPLGRPWIVWCGVDDVGSADREIFWSRWEEGVGWSARQRVYTNNTQRDDWPRFAMAADGTPWTVWLRRNPAGGWDLLSSRYVNGAWTVPDTVVAAPRISDANYFGVAPVDSAHCWVVFDLTTQIRAREYSSGQWQPEEVVFPGPPAGGGIFWQVDADAGPDGLPWAVWSESHVMASHRWADRSWSTPAYLNPEQSDIAYDPEITADSLGEAWATWHSHSTECEGERDIFCARTISGMWQPWAQVNAFESTLCGSDMNASIDASYGWLPKIIWSRAMHNAPSEGYTEPLASTWDSASWSPQSSAHVPDPSWVPGDLYPSIAVGPHGESWATWERHDVGYETDVYAARLLLDVAVLNVQPLTTGVQVYWRVVGPASRDGFRFAVMRAIESDTVKVGDVIVGKGDEYLVVDESVAPGERYAYWVDVRSATSDALLFRTSSHVVDDLTVSVLPTRPAGALSLRVLSNPSPAGVVFEIAGTPGEYSVQIFDVRGRLQWRAEENSLKIPQSGWRARLSWDGAVRLPSGVYWARAAERKGGLSATAKFVLTR